MCHFLWKPGRLLLDGQQPPTNNHQPPTTLVRIEAIIFFESIVHNENHTNTIIPTPLHPPSLPATTLIIPRIHPENKHRHSPHQPPRHPRLPSIYGNKPDNKLLSAAVSFYNADQIQKEGFICIIAKNNKSVVVGTADLNTKSNVVNNVYVREEARQQGIARLMMEAIEDAVITTMDKNDNKPSTLKLTVMRENVAAVGLYKKMGFQALGVYGGFDALSLVTPLDFLMEMEKKLS